MKTNRLLSGIFASFICCGFILSQIIPSNVSAATIVNLNPTADSMVRVNSTNANYGSVTPLSTQGNDLRVTYMKFDLTSLANASIVSAKLRIKTVSDGGSDAGQLIRLISDESWSESTITYNNSYNSSNSGLKPGTQLAALTGGPGSSWIEIPMTTAVSNAKGGLFSFAIVPQDPSSTDDLKINSREASADKPTLVIEYNAAAPTATITKTPTPTTPAVPTATKTPTPSPTTAPVFQGINSGQTVSGNIFVRLTTTSTTVTKVDFLIDGVFINMEDTSPYCLNGDNGSSTCNPYDTKQLTNGTHTLAVKIYNNNGTVNTMQVSFIVNNPTVTATKTPTPSLTKTPTPTIPGAPTATKTPTPTVTKTPTPTIPGAPTATKTPTPSPTVSTVPSPTPTTQPPAIYITNPSNGETIYDSTINVSYNEAGNLSGVDHVHLILDNQPEVRDLDNDGQYFFTNVQPGTHTLKIYLARADHSKFSNPEAETSISFTVSAAPTPTAEPTTTPVPICTTRELGDANCDGLVNFIDFEIWRKEFSGEQETTDANFNYKNGDTKVDIIDFEIWRQGYLSETAPSPTVINDPIGYSLESLHDPEVTMGISEPNSSFGVSVVLKKNNQPVSDQTDFSYEWTIDTISIADITPGTLCSTGVNTPCPLANVQIKAKSLGNTAIRLKVKYLPTQTVVAEINIPLHVVAITPTPSPTVCPQPTPCLPGYTQVQGDPQAGSCPVYSCVAPTVTPTPQQLQ